MTAFTVIGGLALFTIILLCVFSAGDFDEDGTW